MAGGIRHADHVAPSPHKLAIASPTSGGRSVGIICSQTQTMEFKKLCTVSWIDRDIVYESIWALHTLRYSMQWRLADARRSERRGRYSALKRGMNKKTVITIFMSAAVMCLLSNRYLHLSPCVSHLPPPRLTLLPPCAGNSKWFSNS
jgi:hypothetical protein